MRMELQPAPRQADTDAELSRQWLTLEAQAPATVFASWAWVGGWWRRLPPTVPVLVLRVWDADSLVGLGLFAVVQERNRWGFLRRVARLHTCGVAP